MSTLRKSKNIPLWYLIPVALGIHGLVLSIPIAMDEPKEKPPTAPVKMQKLPGAKVAVSPKPNSSPSPVAPTVSSSSPPAAIQTAQPLSVQQPQQQPPQPTQQPTPQPTQQPTPVQQPPVQQPTQQPTPQQPTKPDVFQIQGTTACETVKDCYASTETNGRSVALTLEQTLRTQGYELKEMDLADDTGMKVYQLFLKGAPKDYLHIIWTDQGTRSLRLPQPEKNRENLARIAKL
jgi:hypothetical protein